VSQVSNPDALPLPERITDIGSCDGLGHISRECPLPKDMSKVQCRK